MMDLIGQIVLSLMCLGMAVWAFLRYRKKKNLWLLLGGIAAVLAAIAAGLAWIMNGIFLAVLALALLLLGLWSSRRK
jgi:4-amino-4-deoxy-L-arabinose transferase-like glycosyltransferase